MIIDSHFESNLINFRNNSPTDTPQFTLRSEVVKKFKVTDKTCLSIDGIEGIQYSFSLFNEGDKKAPALHLRAANSEEKQTWIEALANLCVFIRRSSMVQKKRILGVGGQGVVYEAYLKDKPDCCFALKEIEIKNEQQMKSALAEANMLKDIMEHVAHPNIIGIIKIINLGTKISLVFPLCTGGELLEHIIRQRHFQEKHALKITHDLVSALHALHAHNILHLDIKPENILFESTEPHAKIKVTDFGLSRLFAGVQDQPQHPEQEPPQSMPLPSQEVLAEKRRLFIDLGLYASESIQGTIGYMSPELILTGHVSTATDVFSAGVVLYIMLCGDRPFASRSNRQTFMRTILGSYRMNGPEWKNVSSETKDLVRRMLEVDPEKRITTAEILALPFIRQFDNLEENDLSEKCEGSTCLQKLANLVKNMKAEKMARGLTMLNQPGQGNGRKEAFQATPDFQSELAPKFLVFDFGEVSAKISSRGNPFNNEIIRLGLTGAMHVMGDPLGRLTLKQEMVIYRKVGLAGREEKTEEVTLLLLLNFLDSDGDGFITPNDVFTTNALLANRHEVFLSNIFAMYLESLPASRGKKSDLLHLLVTNETLRGFISAGELRVEAFDAAATSTLRPDSEDFFSGRYITAEHVAYMFLKYGFAPEDGETVFNLLVEKLVAKGIQRSKYQVEKDDSVEENGDESRVTVTKIYLDQFIGKGNCLFMVSV